MFELHRRRQSTSRQVLSTVSGATKEVLRVSGLDRGQQGPVGFAGVEQATHSVMSKVDEAELDALDPFGEVVDAYLELAGWGGAETGV